MIPRHVAIILDGNRRFAKRLMLDPRKGHEFGRTKVEQLVDWSIELGIKELTLYTFSIQNFNRPKEEFDYLMNLMLDAFNKFYDDPKVEKNGIRINVIGRYNMFPPKIVESIERIMAKTKHNSKFIINFAMAYGGKEELTDTMKKIALEVSTGKLKAEDVDENVIQKHLYMSSEPDLIVRTGGDKRTSNFLMWQASYSEWFFVEKMWPEFTKEDLVEIFKEFEERERRFGK